MNHPIESTTPADPVVAGGTPSIGSVLDAVHLLRAEYLEMPGLGLTVPQVARFFTVTLEEAQRALSQLVDEELLICGANGVYRRCRERLASR